MRAALLSLALAACASVAPSARLAAMAPFEGCWIGTFAGNTALKDERCFVFDAGRASMRDTHTVVGTGYGGETVYAWDARRRRIAVTYRSSDGAVMTGSAGPTRDGVVIPDARHVGASGAVQELRSTWARLDANRFSVVTERKENGAWREFMRIEYVRTPATR